MSENQAVQVQRSPGGRLAALVAFFLLPMALLATASTSCLVAGGGGRCGTLAVVGGLAYPIWLIYALPTGIALFRGLRNWRSLAAINVLAGWTLVGWVVMLIRATSRTPAASASTVPASGPPEWTPTSWDPPPVGYPMPAAAENAAPTFRDAAPENPSSLAVGAITEEVLPAAASWANLVGAPTWVRDREWPLSTLLVKLCGGLDAYSQGRRLTDGLVSRPAVEFMWVSLLLRWVLEPGRTSSRDGFADEMSPGLDRQTQLSRLRNLLADRNALDPALAGAIRADRRTVGFDGGRAGAGGFVSDVQLLHELAEKGRRDNRYEPSEVGAVETLLAACSAEVLPEWQELDERITGEKGVGAELIGALRSRHADSLTSVRVALAQTYLETGSSTQAVELFKAALQLKPDREDVVRSLVAALTAAGRGTEADAVREEYLS